jgi:hypothetical protein
MSDDCKKLDDSVAKIKGAVDTMIGSAPPLDDRQQNGLPDALVPPNDPQQYGPQILDDPQQVGVPDAPAQPSPGLDDEQARKAFEEELISDLGGSDQPISASNLNVNAQVGLLFSESDGSNSSSEASPYWQHVYMLSQYLSRIGKVIPANASPDELRKILNGFYQVYDFAQQKFVSTSFSAYPSFNSLVSPSRAVEALDSFFSKNEDLERILRNMFPNRLEYFQEIYKNKNDYSQLRKDIERIQNQREIRTQKEKEVVSNITLILSMMPDNDARNEMMNKLNSLLESYELDVKLGPKPANSNATKQRSFSGGRLNGMAKKLRGLIHKKDDAPLPVAPQNIDNKYYNQFQPIQQVNDPLQSTNVRLHLQNFLLNLLNRADIDKKQAQAGIEELKATNDVVSVMIRLIRNGILPAVLSNMKPQEIAASMDVQNRAVLAALRLSLVSLFKNEGFDGIADKLDAAISAANATLSSTILATRAALDALMSTFKQKQVVDELVSKADSINTAEDKTKALLTILPPGISLALMSALSALLDRQKVEASIQTIDASGEVVAQTKEALQEMKGKEDYQTLLSRAMMLLIQAGMATTAASAEATNIDNIISKIMQSDEFANVVKSKLDETTRALTEQYTVGLQQLQNVLTQNIPEVDDLLRKLREGVESMGDLERKQALLKENSEGLGRIIGDIADIVKTKSQGGGGMHGGDQEAIEKAKAVRKKLDDMKKLLRGVTDALGGLKGRYEKFKGYTEQALLDKDNANSLDAERKTIASTEKEKLPAVLDAFEKKVLGMYASVKDDGSKFMQELSGIVKQKKDDLKTVQTTMQEVFDNEPSNTNYVRRGMELKIVIEGDYDQEGAAGMGLLSKLDTLENIVKTEFEAANTKLKSIAEGIKEDREYKIREKQVPIIGAPYAMNRNGQGGGAALTKDDLGSFEKVADHIIGVINTDVLKNMVQVVDQDYLRKTNHVMSAAIGSEPNLFQTLYQNYLDTKATSKSNAIAADQLVTNLQSSRLIPREVLAVTTLDKVVFVFVTLFIRMFALSIVETLVDKGIIKKLASGLSMYLIMYTFIMLLFVAFVNIDIYRMRIIFNYVNLHANGGLLMLHIGLLWLFSFLIFLIMWHINIPLKGVKIVAISPEDKADLMYRLEVVSMIVWLFLLLMIVIL